MNSAIGGAGGSGGSAPFSDATALVKNASDATKTFKVDASGITTGNTVTLSPSGTAAAPVIKLIHGVISATAPGSGTTNEAFGDGALAANTTGSRNTALGYNALHANLTSTINTAIGEQALVLHTTGNRNVGVGVHALGASVTGTSNTAVGTDALVLANSGNENTALGESAGSTMTSGADNVSIGFQSGPAGAAIYNTCVGVVAGQVSTGNFNTAIGGFALQSNTSGAANTAVGVEAGLTDTGANANVTGSNNTWVGYASGPGVVTQLTNAIAIGYQAHNTASNQFVVGDNTVADAYFGSVTPTAWAHFAGVSRVASDLTNATTTFGAVTGLTATVQAGRFYTGEVIIKCINSTATEGVKFDFNGGSATMTGFWAAAGELTGGTLVVGTAISTSLAGVINFSTVTGESVFIIKVAFTVNAAGTIIPRFAENSTAVGTVTLRLGSYMNLNDVL